MPVAEGYFCNQISGDHIANESGVASCAHCQAVLYLHDVPGQKNWRKNGGFCHREMKPLCDACGKRALTYGCEPILKTIESYGESLVKYDQYLKIAGLEPAKPTPQLILPG